VTSTWAGLDVGGRKKGFHVALIDDHRLLGPVGQLGDADEVVALLGEAAPSLVAVDSPRRPAPNGLGSRPDEREFAARKICGIRYTPDRARLDANPLYYEWIDNGLQLYAALDAAGLRAIECFPTASWTQWHGKRGTTNRAEWSARALAGLRLNGLPDRLGQDARDAIAAAVTARLHSHGGCFTCGRHLVVPH
jgi:predicted nuclease with RNAse H fold